MNEDVQLFKTLGLRPKAPFTDGDKPETKESYKISQKKLEQEAKMKAWREEHKNKSAEERLLNVPEAE